MKLAFSTVACPDWTLERVMSFADQVEYDGVELRTFGWGASDLACDPALTDAAKARRLALESGTEIMCLGTSLKFDDPVWPPVVGLALPGHDRALQAARRFIDLANDLECPHLRVFGFEAHGGERTSRTAARVAERLRTVLTAAGKRRVRVVLENGGSFTTARHLADIITACDSPWIGACYNTAVGADAGDRPAEAFELLGDKLWTVKLKDMRDNTPVEIGDGEIPIADGVEWLAKHDYTGWLVVEWMRFWRPELAEPEGVLTRAIETVRGWSSRASEQPAAAAV